MSPLVLIILVVVGLVVFTKISNSFAERVERAIGRVIMRRVDARVRTLRSQPGYTPGAPVGTAPRIRAAAIDVGGALAVGSVAAFCAGLETVDYYSLSGGIESKTTEHFSTLWLLLCTLLAYAATAARAAWRDPEGQTFGQKLFDYAPRSLDGRPLPPRELFRRHWLRLAAGPQALVAVLQADYSPPLHDTWTGTQSLTLGDLAPAGA